MNRTTNKYSPDVRKVLDGVGQHKSRWVAIVSIASQIDFTPQTLNEWVNKVEAGAIGSSPMDDDFTDVVI